MELHSKLPSNRNTPQLAILCLTKTISVTEMGSNNHVPINSVRLHEAYNLPLKVVD